MMKLRIMFVAMLAICGAPGPTFAQCRSLEANSLPYAYDGAGGRHYRIYGYYGDYDPPMPSDTKRLPRQVSEAKVSHGAAPGRRPLTAGSAQAESSDRKRDVQQITR